MSLRKFKRGFTFVELVVVIAIIAILAGVSVPAYFGIVENANRSVDVSLVKNLNTALSCNNVLREEKPKTFHDAFETIADSFASDKTIEAKSNGCTITWDSSINQCYLIDGNDEVVFPTDFGSLPNKEYLWAILKGYDSNLASKGYNEYIISGYGGDEILSVTGIDTGYNIINVTYNGQKDNAIVRTNGGTLTVDNPNAEVIHYGNADFVEIKACKKDTFRLFSVVDSLSIGYGRIIIEEKASIVEEKIIVSGGSYDDVTICYRNADRFYSVESDDGQDVKGSVAVKTIDDSDRDISYVCSHCWGDEQIIAPTCLAGGYSMKACVNCGEELKYDFRDPLGHDYIHHPEQSPTCTEHGWKAYKTCSRCDYTTYEQIAPKGHDIEHHEAKAATCTEHGWKAYDTCKDCGYTTYEETPVLNHELEHHSAKAATCTEVGWEAYDSCKHCSYSTKVETPALGHDYVNHEAKKPTCTEVGWKAYQTCSRCDFTSYEEIPALDHDLIHHEGKDATCTEGGFEEYDTCSRCNYSTYVGTSAKEHNLAHYDKVNATCTEKGSKEYWYCNSCHKYFSDSDCSNEITQDIGIWKVIEATGHSGGTATCTDKAICSKCGQPYGEVLAHSYGHYQLINENQIGRYCSGCSNPDCKNIETTLHEYKSTNDAVADYMSGNNDRTFATYQSVGIKAPSGSWKGGEYSFNVSKPGTLYLRDNSTGRIISNTFEVNPSTVKINSLIPGIEYSYAYIGSDDYLVASGKVKATGKLRLLDVRGFGNFRDIGGLSSSTGTLNYNKIIRGNELGDTDSRYCDTPERDFILKQLCNLTSEVKLGSGASPKAYLTGNQLHEFAVGSGYKDEFISKNGIYANAVKQIITDVNAGKTVYVHCNAGRDRTGTVMLLVEGLLGVSQADMIKDYELTAISSSISGTTDFVALYNHIMTMEGSDLANKIAYWLSKNGVTYDQINAFRNNMCTGTPTNLEAPKTSHQKVDNLVFLPRRHYDFIDGQICISSFNDNAVASICSTENTGYKMSYNNANKINYDVFLIHVPDNAISITINDTSDLTYFYYISSFSYDANSNTLKCFKHTGSKEKYGYSTSGHEAADNHSYSFDVTGADYISILVSKYPNSNAQFDWGDTMTSVGISAYFTIKQ